MKSLNYYLSLATKGNADAAYEAAKTMYYEKYNEVIVQSMLRKAAELGSAPAQRWLGFISLSDKLIDPSSTTSNIKYVNGHEAAYTWFSKAAKSGDTLSAFAVYKCLQHGIGTRKDPEKAAELLEVISYNVTLDILPLMFFFDTYHAQTQKAQSIEFKAVINELLAS